MRCPACGARYENVAIRCPECGALQTEISVSVSMPSHSEMDIVEQTTTPKATPRKRTATRKTQSLIEFPGVNRTAVPEWRKELGERVREIQEKRVREATIVGTGIDQLISESEPKATATLELLPQAELPCVNPLVAKALRRIERAHSQPGGSAAVATAVAYEEQPVEIDLAAASEEGNSKSERVHNLTVVPAPEVISAEPPVESRRPRRVIDDTNDPALNYLDQIATAVRLEIREYQSAGLIRRMLSALTDLAAVALLSSPCLALTRLTTLEWQNPKVIGFLAGAFLVVGFLYLTVSVAFTGRTIGMKLFSLRVVDARTGLIPTGSQSAGRSLVYLLSLASAGIALVYALLDRERQTVHDRFTRTAVIRA
jgi:uncharacterized RDD family membrane protein YckC